MSTADVMADFGSPAVVAGSVLAAGVLAVGAHRVVKAAHRRGATLVDTITVTVAIIATIGAVTGMWRVFTVALRIDPALSALLCAVLELAMFASAIRARQNLREEDGRAGADGIAAWVLAGLSAVLSAAEEQDTVGRAVRLALPLVAVWLWHRTLAADRRATGGVREQVAWRFTPLRVAVWLRVADPAERSASDVDRTRRLARMVRLRLRVAAMESATVPRWVAVLTARDTRVAVARWRWDRAKLAAIVHLGLGQEARVAATIRDVVAAVVRLESATSPAMLAVTAATPARQPRQPATATSATGGDEPDTSPPAQTATTPPLERPVAVSGTEVADMAVAEQVAWFARQMDRHPGRTAAQWAEATGLARRTVERRLAAARWSADTATDAAQGGR